MGEEKMKTAGEAIKISMEVKEIDGGTTNLEEEWERGEQRPTVELVKYKKPASFKEMTLSCFTVFITFLAL